jgi:hypothetical protein
MMLFYRMTGYGAGEIIGKHLGFLFLSQGEYESVATRSLMKKNFTNCNRWRCFAFLERLCSRENVFAKKGRLLFIWKRGNIAARGIRGESSECFEEPILAIMQTAGL